MKIFIVLGGRPGVYTNVYEHKAWIENITVPEHCIIYLIYERLPIKYDKNSFLNFKSCFRKT